MTPSLRAAVIQEWRGLPEKKARSDHWETPDVLLPKLMRKLGLKERLRESEVIDAWSSIVGEFIAGKRMIDAGRAGWGSLLGNLGGMVGKLVIALAMITIFLMTVPPPF